MMRRKPFEENVKITKWKKVRFARNCLVYDVQIEVVSKGDAPSGAKRAADKSPDEQLLEVASWVGWTLSVFILDSGVQNTLWGN